VSPTEPVLEEQHEDRDSVTLVLSGGEILEIAAASLPPGLPPVGQQVPATVLAQLREAAARKQIARRLFQLLDRRLYATATLQAKLQAEGFSAAGIEAVLAEFAAAGLHSDRHFATAFCRDTLRRRPVGPRYLRDRLRRHGVSAAVVVEVLREIMPPARENELAIQAGRERWRKLANAAGPRAEATVYRFLLARGFSSAVARRASRVRPETGDAGTGEDTA